MRNIIITESKFNKLKQNLLNEVVGVPNNILETGEEIYEDILFELDQIDDNEDEYDFEIEGDFRISDVEFKKLTINLIVNEDSDLDEPNLVSMGFGLASEMSRDTYRLQHTFDDEVALQIQVAMPENWDPQSLKQFFKDNKVEFLSSLSHELMHSYSFRKEESTSSKEQAKYRAYSDVKVGIPPVDKFIFALYFTHSIENIVRPTELASQLKSHNVTKKEFYDFFTKTKLYEFLKSIQTETYEDLRNEIKTYLSQLRDYLRDEKGIDDIDEKSDDEVVDIILDLTYEVISKTTAGQMHQMLMNSPIEMLIGFVGEKDKFFRRFLKEITKYDNGPEFFQAQFEFFREVSTKMIKKLAKLYSIRPDKKDETNESKSIHNWDLHHKYRNTKELFPIKRKTTT